MESPETEETNLIEKFTNSELIDELETRNLSSSEEKDLQEIIGDPDLTDVSTDDLLTELDGRTISGSDEDKLKGICEDNGISCGDGPFPTTTMNDSRKVDYLEEVFPHYSLEEIEAALPRRY